VTPLLLLKWANIESTSYCHSFVSKCDEALKTDWMEVVRNVGGRVASVGRVLGTSVTAAESIDGHALGDEDGCREGAMVGYVLGRAVSRVLGIDDGTELALVG
jgi:hypothetical protein